MFPRASRPLFLSLLATLALGLATACAPAAEPTPAPQPTETPVPAPKASVYVFNNKSPHIVEIDAETNTVVRTADVPELSSKWSWVDPDNHLDGNILWAATIDTETGAKSRVFALNLDTLKVTEQIDVGPEKVWLYIGKVTQDGRLHVALHGQWKVAVIETKTRKVLSVYSVPVNAGEKGTPPGWATCDMDVSTGPDGVERAFYPTLSGNTVVSLDAATGKVLKEAPFPELRPVMLTAAPDGTVWVQEGATSTNAVLNPVTLDVLTRFSTGKGPALASFSPDGKLGFVSGGDTTITVVDAEKYRVLRRVEVGANAQMVAAHPNGKYLYVIITKENAVAVVDTTTWEVIKRIDLGTAPSGLFVRKR